jgi:CubicO group peptidase (beta-lactamase class C family)
MPLNEALIISFLILKLESKTVRFRYDLYVCRSLGQSCFVKNVLSYRPARREEVKPDAHHPVYAGNGNVKHMEFSRRAKRARRIGIIVIFFLTALRLPAQYRFAGLDDWMDAQTKNMGGRAILVVFKNDSLVYAHSVGQMNASQKAINKYIAKKQGRPADLSNYTLESQQPVASCSKWFSAALVMTFVDEGRLQLRDSVGKYLPELSACGKGKITLGDCLSHLTGVKAPPIRESLKEVRHMTGMEEAIDEIARMPMEGEPGKTFHYSSVGLQIAASVIEKISGKSFQTLFEERIAAPLGMTQTNFGHKPFVLPAGGAVSSPADYIHFLTMILGKGQYRGKRILSAESIRQMEINRLGPEVVIKYSPEQANVLGYGYGEWVLKDSLSGSPGRWITSPGLFGSFPWVENDQQYCAFLMTFYMNGKGRQDRYFELKKLVDEALE